MLLLRGFVLIAAIGVWIYTVFDVIRSEAGSVRYLHKLIWLVLVLVFSPIGPLAWLFLGRPVPIGSRLFEAPASRKPPDDSPEFLASLDDEIKRRRRTDRLRPREADQEDIDAEINRLEEELRRRARDEGGEDLS